MPGPARELTRDGARKEIVERSFGAPDQGLVGIELEWHLFDPTDPTRHVPADMVDAISPDGSSLAGGGRVTHEPGGQVEVSTAPAAGLVAAVEATRADLADLVARAAARGVVLAAGGVDPLRPPRRITDHPRYVAMETFFDAGGPAGRLMMGGCASIQINVDAGDGDVAESRWRLLHDIGPAMVAAFACSPLVDGEPSGAMSTRMRTWWQIDPSRTRAAAKPGHGLDAWIDFVLDAHVMFIRRSERCYEPILTPLPFSTWMDDGHELGWPTLDDLDYHLTTLFPPVRVRGHYEVRYVDAVPDPWWQVATAVIVTLATDPAVALAASEAVGAVRGAWDRAMTDGMRDAGIAAAVDACFALARDVLVRDPEAASLVALLDDYTERYVAQRRMPADDLLDAHAARASLLAPLAIPVPA